MFLLFIWFRYQAIQFGSERVGKGLTIVDRETGDLLGGKKAAIQFYHDKQNKEMMEDLGEILK